MFTKCSNEVNSSKTATASFTRTFCASSRHHSALQSDTRHWTPLSLPTSENTSRCATGYWSSASTSQREADRRREHNGKQKVKRGFWGPRYFRAGPLFACETTPGGPSYLPAKPGVL